VVKFGVIRKEKPVMEEIIKIINLRKTFKLSAKQKKIEKTKKNVKVAVDDISFSVNKGEIFGLLGPNGAGKTTTLRMLATLIKPDSGDAVLNGESIVKNPFGVRETIGFLTSELKIEDFFTPNYLFDFFSDLHGVETKEREERKAKLFSKFGIDKFAEVKVGDLSQGMKQKLSLVISIVHNPEIIIFDEPTNGLDVITAKTVVDYLVELKEEGKTIVISSHIFSLIEKICDRAAIIIEGRLTACGSIEEIKGGKSLEDRFFDIYKEVVGSEE